MIDKILIFCSKSISNFNTSHCPSDTLKENQRKKTINNIIYYLQINDNKFRIVIYIYMYIRRGLVTRHRNIFD